MKTPKGIRKPICACLILSLCFINAANAQNLMGYTSNYAGAISTNLNPSSISNSKLSLDINFITFGGHLQNNYYLIPKDTYNPINPFDNGFADFNAYQGYETKNKHQYLYTKEQLHFPSIMFSNGKNAFGVHLSWRFEADTKDVPDDIIKTMYDGLYSGKDVGQDLNTDKHADKFHFAIGSWEELGATYSRTFKNDGNRYLAAGITANLLLGNAAFYYNNKAIDYYYKDSTSISFDNVNADFGGVIPTGLINGMGLGIDLGITYCISDSAKTNKDNPYFNYKYKFGAAISDLGGIRYGNGFTYEVNSYNSTPNVSNNTVNDVSNLGEQVGGLQTSDHLNFYLPSALSLQFDYNLNNKIFISANYINNLRFTGAQIRRPTVLTITPRYERRWFEVSVPISLYEWSLPRIGFEIRLWNLVFGAEKLGWLLNLQDYTGVDGYVSLRYNIGKKTKKSMF